MALPRFGRTAFLLCDIQEGFRSHIYNYGQVIKTAQRMMAAAEILNIPLIATEQYPKGLGRLVSELGFRPSQDGGRDVVCFEKKLFSMITPEVEAVLQKNKVESVVLFGIESHVCIYQTALDLLRDKYDVHLVADGISSRHQFNVDLTMSQLREYGCQVVSSESILFQLMKSAEHPGFRHISNLVKTSNL